MALVNIQEKWTGAEAGEEKATGVTTLQSSSRRVWTVLFDGNDEADTFANNAIAAVGIPDIGDEFPTREDQTAITKRAIHLGPLLYEVTVEYGGKVSPLFQQYIRSWESAHSIEPIDRDFAGNLIANTVGDPITGVTKRFSDSVYVVTRNEIVFSLANAQQFRNTLNSHNFYNADPGQVFMSDITGRRDTTATETFWAITYKMIFRAPGLQIVPARWTVRALNEGTHYLSSGVRTPVVNKTLSRTAKLDEDGTLLAAGEDDFFREFDVYGRQNFNDLALLENQSGGL